MTRVLIVDDQALVRSGLRQVLAQDRHLSVVGECTDGDEVLDAVTRERPDVVLMDVRMKRVDGAAATRLLNSRSAPPPVLILTMFDDHEIVAAALAAGASGFLLKNAPGEEIVQAVHAVADGRGWLDPAVVGQVLASYRSIGLPHAREARELAQLTSRERDVLGLIGHGATNDEIAARLHISVGTVKTHVGHIFAKLDLRDRPAAVILAIRHGLSGDGGPRAAPNLR